MKINNVRVYGLEESIIASSYPMKTELLIGEDFDDECKFLEYGMGFGLEDYNDESVEDFNKHLNRVKHLGNAIPNSGHDCFLKGIVVQADITAPQYFWLQWERYHFQDTISSQSTMHRITKMDLEKQMNKYVLQDNINNLKILVDLYNNCDDFNLINERLESMGCKVEVKNKSELFEVIISNTPEGIELTRRLTFNYLQLKSMYNQRKNHKLSGWRETFCPWILTLPHFKELCFKI